MGLARSGFTIVMPRRPKSGRSGIWLVNISSIEAGERMRADVLGEVPELRSAESISVVVVLEIWMNNGEGRRLSTQDE